MAKSRNLANTSTIGSTSNVIAVPTGTTAQRTHSAAGFIRYNTDLNSLESANGVHWANVGSGSASSGSSGGAVSGIFYENSNQITENYTSPAGKNMFSVGPIVMNTEGILVQITGNAVWQII